MTTAHPSHFLTLNDLDGKQLRALVERAGALKKNPALAGQFPGKMLCLLFEKPSTRTRIAFEVAIQHLGGGGIFLTNADSQLGRGEPIEDTARVISSMADCIAIRTFDHSKLMRFAEFSSVPVINALSDEFHPCQLLADMQTWIERRGDIRGKTVAWVGDGCNVCQSYINAAALFDFQLRIACPVGYEPDAALLKRHGDRVRLGEDPAQAVAGADLVVTDVWASMGKEQEQARRNAGFAAFQVNGELMAEAAPDALFMHCLPAHRGEEVSAEVLDGPQSVVWDQAENRLHSQKALLELLLAP